MGLRMNKVRSWLLILAGIAFVLDPVLIGFVNATEVTLPSGDGVGVERYTGGDHQEPTGGIL